MPKILRVACKIKKDLLYKQVFCFLMQEIAALVSFARNDKGIPQGIAALVALARNDNARPSLRGHLCPWQSHTWNKKSCYTFLMAEIAALVALARNDNGIPQGIAALVSLARNDMVASHCEGACTRGNLLRNTRTIRLKNRGGHAILYV